ncbi:MAG: methyltransferase domain-containing protein [Proteobacteria bacterium]|nr:methyltransferase domain-containing protein [Pseudomonadota bacterium]
MSEQTWNAQGYQTNAGFVPVLGRPVLELLAPRPGEHILDLGCGDGALTVELVAAGATVVGIDASQEMIASAREKGLNAHVADAAHLSLDGAFDAVFSNAELHWVKDADGAIASAWRALRPGGRFVGEFGGHGNVAAIVTALFAVLARRGVDAAPFHPWFYPTLQAYRARLEAAGFRVDSIALVPRPTPLPTGMAGWLATFANPFMAALPEADRKAALAEVVDLLRPALCDDRGDWTADYVRLRFAATRPA